MYWLLALCFVAVYGLFIRWRYRSFTVPESTNTEMATDPAALHIDERLKRRFARFAVQNTLVAVLLVLAFFWLANALGLR